ncbi:MAG TPA: hypothetical protein VMU32_10040 [Solirubrobacteraceae bacterium]|nr:hypothetical protein [Solirubrobacteraceae bacterium]
MASGAAMLWVGSPLARAEGVFTNLSLPTISGSAVEGETLQEQPARWSSTPTGYTYSWQRCDSSGEHCESIKKANAETYLLTSADVGHTLRVSESAADAAGAVTPAVSEPTAVVQAGNGGQGGGGGQSGGGQSGGGQNGGGHGGEETSKTNTPSPTSPAKLRKLLAHELSPSGRADSRTALLAHGSLGLRISLPVSGTLIVRWYLPVSGAHGGHGQRPTLVASSIHAMVRAGKAGTLELRLTARGKQLLRHPGDSHLKAQGSLVVKGGKTIIASSSFSLRG